MASDIVILALGVILAALYLFRDQIFALTSSAKANVPSAAVAEGDDDPRDFIEKMKSGKKRLLILYGSQTGTAEEYSIRLAKEAKAKFGLTSLVCDTEDYDFEKLDQVPEDACVFFVMATYGEGDPTDNAVTFFQNMTDESFEFSGGAHKLEGLKYVIFGLGNTTYERYNHVSRTVDKHLADMGAQRIGERGEGDDDKSMEEDYLEWKDTMWEAFSQVMGVEEGMGTSSPDFVVTELDEHPAEKVYLGELSARALTRTKGIHDAKNPFPAVVSRSVDLFKSDERSCVHVELNTEGSGMTYQHGDHLGIWATNTDIEVDRLLCVLGLYEKRDTVIGVESLDPALAKVPFPVPTTYGTVLRHYIDITAVAGRQILGPLSQYGPTPEAVELMKYLNGDKEAYANLVAKGCLKLGEVLQFVAGNDISVQPTPENTSKWAIPFDLIISAIPRLQPRFYSIASSPKLNPNSIHITAVVLQYESAATEKLSNKWVYGIGSNFLWDLKYTANKNEKEIGISRHPPAYAVRGPRDLYVDGDSFKCPIHVRRSTFRLPTNPRSPVIMIGPGTGVAPFRSFVQERVALARRSLDKNGPNALADWGQIRLYYGCRRDTEDYIYKDEWPEYERELKGKFNMRIAFSRQAPFKPDGGKFYVQDLLWEDRKEIAEAIINGKGYLYVCGDAKTMSKGVEEAIAKILGEAKGGTAEVEGMAEVRMLKDRSRYLTDVWS